VNYGRGVLDRAMQGLQSFDNSYATRVQDLLAGNSQGFRKGISEFVGSPLTPPRVELEDGAGTGSRIARRAYQVAAPLVGGITRYGIPAAGVTAAGMGLMELTDRMNQQTESTLSVQ